MAFFPSRVVMLLGPRKKDLVRWPHFLLWALSLLSVLQCLKLQKGALPHLILLQRRIVLGHTRIIFGRSAPVLQI